MTVPIRILHVVTHMNRGGLETMLMNYYRNMDRQKIQFDFLTHRKEEKDYDKEIRELGGNIYSLPELNPFSIKYLKKLNQFFVEHNEYSIVHSHLDTMSAFPLRAAMNNGIPIRIAHGHSNIQEMNPKYLVKILSKLLIPKYATHLFACGETAGKWLYGREKFKVISNAIDANNYIYNEDTSKKTKDSLGLKGKFVIGHIGRFSTPKNHKFLIDIFNEVHKKNINSVLLLVGTGDLKDEIETKVKKMNLSKSVIFLGLRTDISQLLQTMDVFVFPSTSEGLGIVAVEAQAAGLMTIVSEAIPKEAYITNLIVKQKLIDSASVWANEILKYNSNYNRTDMSELLRKNGYDIKEAVKTLQTFYLEEFMKLNKERLKIEKRSNSGIYLD